MEAHGSASTGVGAIVTGIELGALSGGQGMVVVGVDVTVRMRDGGRRGRRHARKNS